MAKPQMHQPGAENIGRERISVANITVLSMERVTAADMNWRGELGNWPESLTFVSRGGKEGL